MVIIKMLHTINRALKRLDDFKKQQGMMANITPTEEQRFMASFAGDLAIISIFKREEMVADGGYLQVRYDDTIEHISAFLEGERLVIYLPRKGRFVINKHEISNPELSRLAQETCYDLEDALRNIRETLSNIHNDDNLLAVKLCLLLGVNSHHMGELNARALTDALTGRERFIPDYGENLFTQEEKETYFPKGGVINISDKELLSFLLSKVIFSINAIPAHAISCYSNKEAHKNRWRLNSMHINRKTPLSQTYIGDFYGSDNLVGIAEESSQGMLLTLSATTYERTLFLSRALGARNMNAIEGVAGNLSIMTGSLKDTFLSLSSKSFQEPNKSTRQGFNKLRRLNEGALGQEEVF